MATERLFEALRVNNVEVLSVEDKAEENEDVFYVCESSTSGGRLLTQIGWLSARAYGFFLRRVTFYGSIRFISITGGVQDLGVELRY